MDKACLLEGDLIPNHGITRERVKKVDLAREDHNLEGKIAMAARFTTILAKRVISRGIARSGSRLKRKMEAARVMVEKLQ